MHELAVTATQSTTLITPAQADVSILRRSAQGRTQEKHDSDRTVNVIIHYSVRVWCITDEAAPCVRAPGLIC